MHSFRLRYVALGLLIYIQSAFSDTCQPDSADLPSLVARSPTVLEGHAVSTARLNTGQYLVQFKVLKLYKGKLPGVSRTTNGANDSYVFVGLFGSYDDQDACVASIDKLSIGSRTSYLVFLNVSGRPRASLPVERFVSLNLSDLVDSTPVVGGGGDVNGSRSVFYYEISGLPENATVQSRARVRTNKGPRRRKAVANSVELISEKQFFVVGEKLHMQCRIGRHQPQTNVLWFRNETALTKGKHISIHLKKHISTLQIRRTWLSDAGVYQCKAVNVNRELESRKVTIEISDGAHMKFCEEANFCLNKGTCYFVMQLRKKVCKCKKGFLGKRCEERETALDRTQGKKRKKRMHYNDS